MPDEHGYQDGEDGQGEPLPAPVSGIRPDPVQLDSWAVATGRDFAAVTASSAFRYSSANSAVPRARGRGSGLSITVCSRAPGPEVITPIRSPRISASEMSCVMNSTVR